MSLTELPGAAAISEPVLSNSKTLRRHLRSRGQVTTGERLVEAWSCKHAVTPLLRGARLC